MLGFICQKEKLASFSPFPYILTLSLWKIVLTWCNICQSELNQGNFFLPVKESKSDKKCHSRNLCLSAQLCPNWE